MSNLVQETLTRYQHQAGDRADREVGFYEQLKQAIEASKSNADHRDAFLRRLASFIPQYYGVQVISGHQYLILEDVCCHYQQPCVLDIKIGFRTWYPWASEAAQQKYRKKDESTTQSTLGFRICGVQVYNQQTGQVWKVDRHWGKGLTAADMVDALCKAANTGVLGPKDIFGGQGGAIQQLQQLASILQQQSTHQFFSSSVLVTFEGAACTAEDAQVRVSLVDFAHVFPSQGEIDHNFLDGLQSLITTVQQTI
eukprot:jgi/Chrzof1/3416/Cz12g24150.t1